MGKNTNKKAKFKPIVFEVRKSTFRKALKNALSCIYFEFQSKSILSGIHFKIDNQTLTLAATDGNVLIKQDLEVDEVISGGTYQLTLSGQYLYKTAFKNSYEYGRKSSMQCFDKLRITINEESAIIEDILNGISYTIPALGGESYKFPEYEKLIPKNLDKNKNYTKVGFNTHFLARFKEISHPRSRIGVLRINKENPLAAMVVTANNENDGINTTALLMPIQIRE